MGMRKEKDSLGEREVPEQAYWGIQTLRASENFPVSHLKAHPILVRAYIFVKKACVLANRDLKTVPDDKAEAIITAANEVLEGKLQDQFIIDVYQAGAGTSFNMNVNEVLANRALEILGKPKGDYETVSPNDHVNRSQSTNDTFPTATHAAILLLLPRLTKALEALINAYAKKAKEFKGVLKSARTHLQDAVPITLGQEFEAYAVALEEAYAQIESASQGLRSVALGGTAAGTGMNAPSGFKDLAVSYLANLTSIKLMPSRDNRYALQSHFPIANFSASLRNLSLELIRLANDLRLLASGPLTGLGEIVLPAVQPGSSIMPGKVNPSMAEAMNQIAFDVIGADQTVALAAQAGQLDLNVMTPVAAYRVLHSMEILSNFLPVFAKKGIEGILAEQERCQVYFGTSPSLATVLTPKIGYLKSAEIFKEALATKKTVLELVKQKNILSDEEMKQLFDPKVLTGESDSTGNP
ncbi:MAG: aspartate ammonia-lyase [Elusimicrobia bacterium]|nr:aspartate ammonia-lyase [Elusimicrobiota bacterium]